MTEQYQTSLEAFQQADDAWGAELVRVYKGRAGDARYNSLLNGSTMELQTLKAARDEAMRAYEYQKIRQRVALAAM